MPALVNPHKKRPVRVFRRNWPRKNVAYFYSGVISGRRDFMTPSNSDGQRASDGGRTSAPLAVASQVETTTGEGGDTLSAIRVSPRELLLTLTAEGQGGHWRIIRWVVGWVWGRLGQSGWAWYGSTSRGGRHALGTLWPGRAPMTQSLSQRSVHWVKSKGGVGSPTCLLCKAMHVPELRDEAQNPVIIDRSAAWAQNRPAMIMAPTVT